jgi:protoporphyrin/coproporphyrin ferrochelatase
MGEPRKIAVVLFNLGGPQREEDIAPFLYNFFMDPNIIGLPLPFRWLAAKYISRTRSRGAARDAYSRLGFKSPLPQNSQAQADALEAALAARGLKARCFVSMRYWHPMAEGIVRKLEDYTPDDIVLLPLYPQYSRTTTGSSFADFRKRWQGRASLNAVCCYPADKGFVAASAERIVAELDKAPAGARLLLSAHGLPEKNIRRGDPYQRQCEETAAAIVAHLKASGFVNLDWQICYQSRVGPLKWIGPSIGAALEQAARDGKGVVVYPHAFVSEHVETLVELDIEYRNKAAALGLPHYARAQTVGTHAAFIGGLADLVTAALDGRAAACGCDAATERKRG